jgi:hypothetical protein
MSEIINFACVTQNRIKNMQRNIPKILPYVDRAVIVDGYSVDGTKEWLESYSDKITVVQRKWDDSFANQYNRYLDEIKEGWVLICDDDELPSKRMLESLRSLVDNSDDGNRYSIVEFTCHPLCIDKEGKIVEDNGPATYWRQIFFKYNPGMRYMIDLHQAIVGYKNQRQIRRKEEYYHIKSEEDNFRNACRNWWIDGVWLPRASNGYHPPEWQEFKDVIRRHYPHVNVFNDVNEIFIKGNIHPEVKKYLEKIKDIQDEPPKRLFNELRAFYRYYYEFLHPEEKE